MTAKRRRYDDEAGRALLAAARDGDIGGIRAAIATGANIEIKSTETHKRTPLLEAAIHCRHLATEYLIQAGADMLRKGRDGFSLLHYAALSGNVSLAEDLVRRGAPVSLSHRGLGTPLCCAAACLEGENAALRLVHELLEHGAKALEWAPDFHLPCPLPNTDYDLRQKFVSGMAALHLATLMDYRSVMALLLDRGAKANVRCRQGDKELDDEGRTPLFFARSPEAVRLLLEHGADPNALIQGHIAAIFEIPSPKDSAEAEAMMWLLLRAGHKPTPTGADRKTLLHIATSPEMVRFLLKLGLDPNARDNRGRTPLHYASGPDIVETTRLLLEAGADPDATDDLGRRPISRGYFNAELMDLYLRYEADWKSPMKYYGTRNYPLPLAIVVGSSVNFPRQILFAETLEVLKRHGVPLDMQDAQGYTALLQVVKNGWLEATEVLIKLGCDPTIRNHEGHNAFDIANELSEPGPVLRALRSRDLPVG